MGSTMIQPSDDEVVQAALAQFRLRDSWTRELYEAHIPQIVQALRAADEALTVENVLAHMPPMRLAELADRLNDCGKHQASLTLASHISELELAASRCLSNWRDLSVTVQVP